MEDGPADHLGVDLAAASAVAAEISVDSAEARQGAGEHREGGSHYRLWSAQLSAMFDPS